MTHSFSLADLNSILHLAPFHQWLGLRAAEIAKNSITIEVPWRKEFVSNPQIEATHGGILASLIDLAGLYTIIVAGGSVSATADLHVDYHRAALPGTLIVKTQVLKLGSCVSTARATIHDTDEKILASGRGAYIAGSTNAATTGGSAVLQ